jgi:hypothetical protein
MSERLLKTLRKSGDFQAEYEGSIPFTRSNFFNSLAHQELFISTIGHFAVACRARRLIRFINSPR